MNRGDAGGNSFEERRKKCYEMPAYEGALENPSTHVSLSKYLCGE